MFTILVPMTDDLGEQIRVAAVFSCGRVRPVWFDRKGRQVRLQEAAFSWTSRQGRAEVVHFSVADSANLYEIRWNRETLIWTLQSSRER